MKTILIIAATPRSNHELAQSLAALAPADVKVTTVVLEELNLPLYTPTNEATGIPPAAIELSNLIIAAGAMVCVAPEYNGSVPPVYNNAIAWVSRTQKEWRAGFIDKFAAVATMSGGGGARVVQMMRSQLEHLGTTVHSHALVCGPSKALNPDSGRKIMSDLAQWQR